MFVTFLSDFGLRDDFVGTCHGVIARIAPDARVIDITHGIEPQAVLQGALVLASTLPYMPHGVHLAVVDPGVGGRRRAVCARDREGRLHVGPDNGLLLPAVEHFGGVDGAWELRNRAYMLERVSHTFHGRDVFAPAAAHLSLGVPPEELGEGLETLLAFPPLRAHRCADGSLRAQVVHIDRFGNVVTDARAEDLPEGSLVVELAGRRVVGPARTYAEAAGLTALVGSSGYLEVALPNGSAAAALGVDIGEGVVVRPERSPGR